MKIIHKLSKGFLPAALISISLASCSEDVMDRINKDNDHTTNVPAKFILADVITSTAFNNVGGDLNTYFSIYVEHMVGIESQTANAEKRNGEPMLASTFNNVWINLYDNLKNARIAIEKASEGVSPNYTTKGIAEVMAAMNSALIADAFGDVPYSQAALPGLVNGLPEFLTPKIDSQKDVYSSILGYLDAAIEDLPKGDHLKIGNFDFVYGLQKGITEREQANLWLKLAYGLKARYTMRQLVRSTSQETDLQKVIEYVDHSFASIDEQAAFAAYDATNINPFFNYQWSRSGLSASKSYADKLMERNDPRLRRVFCTGQLLLEGIAYQIDGAEDPLFDMALNGVGDPVMFQYNMPIFSYAQTCPTLLMSYHELLFLKAEAQARLGLKEAASLTLKRAVVAAMANMEIGVKAAINAPTVVANRLEVSETTAPVTSEEAETYYDNSVKPRFDVNPVKEVMIQKYLSFLGAFGESTECYNDVRRLKALNEDYIDLDNPYKFPHRAPYGADDVSANPNVESAYGNGQYVYTDPVWWAGGSR